MKASFLVLALGTIGCIPVPPRYTPNCTTRMNMTRDAFPKPGETRESIALRLGEPDAILDEHNRIWVYVWDMTTAVIPGPYGGGTERLSRYELRVEFDARGIVRHVR